MFCANDALAVEVLESCLLAGRRVPDEIAVVGADNDEVRCELAPQSLSSVALPHEAIGAEAARRLRRLMLGGEAGPAMLFPPGAVVCRRSSEVPDGDPVVARARACIRDRCRETLAVDAIAAAAGVHRRALERRFRAALGRSVHDELRRVRISLALELLLDGSQSVNAIASAVGLSPSAFGEAFAVEVGGTPGAWRRRRTQPPR